MVFLSKVEGPSIGEECLTILLEQGKVSSILLYVPQRGKFLERVRCHSCRQNLHTVLLKTFILLPSFYIHFETINTLPIKLTSTITLVTKEHSDYCICFALKPAQDSQICTH